MLGWLFAILFFIVSANAGDTNKLTVARCLEINAALSSLDGYEKDGKQVPYKLGMNTRIAIAHNLSALRDIKTAYDQADAALILEVTNGTAKLVDGAPETVRYNIGRRKLLSAEQDVKFEHIKTEDLLAGDNPIPPSVLSALSILLD